MERGGVTLRAAAKCTEAYCSEVFDDPRGAAGLGFGRPHDVHRTLEGQLQRVDARRKLRESPAPLLRRQGTGAAVVSQEAATCAQEAMLALSP